MAPKGWTNSWDVAATGVYRPGVEQAHEDQLERLRDSDPTVDPSTSLAALLVAVLFVLLVAAFIFFPQQLAAIFA